MPLSNIFLFIGTILVAFQIVSDIGYLATIFALPFDYPVSVSMKKLGITFVRVNKTTLSYRMFTPKRKGLIGWIRYIGWFLVFIVSICIVGCITLATQPIMIVYIIVGRTLFQLNKFLNFAYESLYHPWEIIYLIMTHRTIGLMKSISINLFQRNPYKKKISDKDLIKIRKKKGELPFVAFIGLIFIITAFILQIMGK